MSKNHRQYRGKNIPRGYGNTHPTRRYTDLRRRLERMASRVFREVQDTRHDGREVDIKLFRSIEEVATAAETTIGKLEITTRRMMFALAGLYFAVSGIIVYLMVRHG